MKRKLFGTKTLNLSVFTGGLAKLSAIALLALGLVLAGCPTDGGGDDNPDPGPGPGPSGDITYTVNPNGKAGTETSTSLTFTFSKAVEGLTEGDITIANDTGSASKGTVAGGGTSWNLGITAAQAGTIKVKVAKAGIENSEKQITVHKAGQTETVDEGSSQAEAIPLSITQWIDGSVVTDGAVWYKFTAASGTSYRVQWKDGMEKPANDTYTAVIKVTAYQSDGTTKISSLDGRSYGWRMPGYVSDVSGTVYLKVEPRSYISDAGTYAIRFYDPAIVIPQIPLRIYYAYAGPGSVVVDWQLDGDATGHRVYRSTAENGLYTPIANIDGFIPTYTDTDVTAGTVHWYKVAAYNSIGEGEKSPAVQSDAVAGPEVGTAITVGASITPGNLSSATQIDWYKFTAESGTAYFVQWGDSVDQAAGDSYTGWITVSAFKSDGTPIINIRKNDRGWTLPSSFIGVSGTVYLRVEGYMGSSGTPYTGTYGIKVYTAP